MSQATLSKATLSKAISADTGVTFRKPRVTDGAKIWNLVCQSGVLDENSCYAYVLLCDHFADTCLVAEMQGDVVGFVSAYRPPVRPDAVFVWQIGVSAKARRQGLGKRLLRRLLNLPACRDADYLEATVSPSNRASRRLFRSVAEDFDAHVEVLPCYDGEDFPGLDHEEEELFQIGPLQRNGSWLDES